MLAMFPSELEFWCCAHGSLSTCHEILGCLNRLLLLLMLLLRALFLLWKVKRYVVEQVYFTLYTLFFI